MTATHHRQTDFTRLKLLGLVLLTVIFVPAVRANICTWTGGGGNNYWTNAANWGGTAPVSGDSLVFAGSTALVTTNKFTSTTFSNITFDASAGAFSLNGNSFTLTGSIINNSTSLQTLGLPISCTTTAYVNTVNGNITINGVISGGCRLYKQGSQTLTLGGNNTYSVGTTIAGGILSVSQDNGTTHQLGALSATCTLTFAGGSLAVTGGALYGTSLGVNQNWLLRNCILGSGGGSVVSGVELGHENYSSIGEYFTGGTLGNGLTLMGGDITIRPGQQNKLGQLTVGTGRCFLRNQHGNGYPVAGADLIVVSNSAALVFVDTMPRNVTNAMIFFSGANLCNRTNATTSVSAETMTLSTTNVTFPSAGQMIFNNDDQKTTNIVINGAWPVLTGNLAIQVGSNNPTIGPVTLNGAIGGNYALTTTGSLTLTAASSYTGGTTITRGTLMVQADGGLGTGNVTVNNSAALTLNSGATNGYINSGASLLLNSTAKANLNFTGSNTIAGLSFDGGTTFQAGGTWGSTSSTAANQNSHFTGTGVLNVVLPTATAVTSSANPSAYGQSVSFTATVTATVGTPTGTVQFQTNGVNFGSAVTLSGGSASSGTLPAKLVVGNYTVTANYFPSGNFTGSSGTLAGGQTINLLPVNLTGTRAYDGTANAAAGILTVANALSGDVVSVVSGSGTLASTTAGPQAITAFGDLALGGTAAGNYTLAGATGSVTITAGEITQVNVETAADGSGTVVPSQSLAKSNSLAMYAIARDGGGDFVANVSAVWSVTNAAGGVVGGDLVPAPDGKSAIFTGHASGMGTVLTTTNGWVGQSGLLAVPIDSGTVHLPLLEGAGIVTAQPVSPNQSYWINGTNNNKYVQWAIETGSGVGGSAAAVARPGPAASGGSANYIQALRTYYFPVWPNTPYTIRFSYQANGPGFSGANDATGSQLQFQALESPYLTGGSFLSTAGTNILNGTAGWTNGAYAFTTTPGTHCLCLKFGVMFGNGNQTNPADSFYLDDDRGTTVVLASTANPSPYGQPLNFTATVVPINPALGTPTGTVQFQTNGVNFGDAVTLSGGKATSATLPPTLLLGNYTVTAAYSGDTIFTAGTGALANGQTIYLQTIFTYNGTAQGPALGGIWPDGANSVIYAGTTYQGDSYFGTGAPTEAGSYSVTNTTLAENNENGLTNCQGFVILRATNAVQLTSSSVFSTYGDTVTFTGLIQTNGVAAQDATGNLIFAVDGAMVATNALVNGVATYSTSSLTATGHNIALTYSGDINYTNNATGMLTQNVTPASSAFSGLTASQSISYGTTHIDLNGRLSAGAGLYPPQGEALTVAIAGLQTNATILDGGGNFSLSFPTAVIPAGPSPYIISYAYAGDGNFIATNDNKTSLKVNPAAASVSLQNLNQTYNGTSASATVTTMPANLVTSVTYDGRLNPPTNAGSYTVVAIITDSNYQGAATNTLQISPASCLVTLSNLSQSFDGTGKYATCSTYPTNLNVSLAYDGNPTAPTNTGSYTVVATVADSNYQGAATNTLIISPALGLITLNNLNQTYDGAGKAVSYSTIPTNLAVSLTYNGNFALPTNAGSYTIIATLEDSNYQGEATNTLTIGLAPAAIALTNLIQTYTGVPIGVTAMTAPANLPVNLTYNGSTNAPTTAGGYTVVAIINDVNYQGSVTNTLLIAQAAQTISFDTLPLFVLGDAPYPLSASVSSGLPVSYASSDPSVASVAGSLISFLAVGSTIITATQVGNSNYFVAITNQALLVTNSIASLNISQNKNTFYTNITLTITGNPGRTYNLQYQDDIRQTNWQTLQIITNLPSATYQVYDPATNSPRFYRLQHPVWTPN